MTQVESRQPVDEEIVPLHIPDSHTDLYMSSPDAVEGAGLVAKNRLEEFYNNEMICEFEDCECKAIHHCVDGNLYWEGCGRVFCDQHAKSVKDTEDGEALAFVCTDCNQRQKDWRCYSFLTLLFVLLSFGILWKLSVIEKVSQLLNFYSS